MKNQKLKKYKNLVFLKNGASISVVSSKKNQPYNLYHNTLNVIKKIKKININQIQNFLHKL